MKHAAILLVFIACSQHKDGASPQNTAKPVEATCSAQAAELKSFVTRVLDKTGPSPSPPWPTGDIATDKEIEDARAAARAAAAPVDPAAPRAQLTQGTKPGKLEHLLDPCPAARAQLDKVGEAPPGQHGAAFEAVADAIADCDCRKLDLPLWRALVFITFRGPDVAGAAPTTANGLGG
jgi:hypothetical protein